MLGTPIRMMTAAASVVALAAFVQAPASAQDDGSRVLKVGTTFSYEGVMVPQGKCQEYVTYQQFGRISGQVILPETKANVFNLMEYWGRDTGNQILRISPSGRAFMYVNRTEYEFSSFGQVGTSFEITDPDSGQTLRLVIAEVGVTITLPTGVVYDNLTRMNTYCVSCGAQPVLLESRWYNRENPLGVLFRADNTPCWPRWHWLVSITGK